MPTFILTRQFLTLLAPIPQKWPNTLKQFGGKLRTNCLSVFGHFVKRLNERNKISQDVKNFTLTGITSSTFTRVKLRERSEENSEPSHIWYDISSIGGMQLSVF